MLLSPSQTWWLWPASFCVTSVLAEHGSLDAPPGLLAGDCLSLRASEYCGPGWGDHYLHIPSIVENEKRRGWLPAEETKQTVDAFDERVAQFLWRELPELFRSLGCEHVEGRLLAQYTCASVIRSSTQCNKHILPPQLQPVGMVPMCQSDCTYGVDSLEEALNNDQHCRAEVSTAVQDRRKRVIARIRQACNEPFARGEDGNCISRAKAEPFSCGGRWTDDCASSCTYSAKNPTCSDLAREQTANSGENGTHSSGGESRVLSTSAPSGSSSSDLSEDFSPSTIIPIVGIVLFLLIVSIVMLLVWRRRVRQNKSAGNGSTGFLPSGANPTTEKSDLYPFKGPEKGNTIFDRVRKAAKAVAGSVSHSTSRSRAGRRGRHGSSFTSQRHVSAARQEEAKHRSQQYGLYASHHPDLSNGAPTSYPPNQKYPLPHAWLEDPPSTPRKTWDSFPTSSPRALPEDSRGHSQHSLFSRRSLGPSRGRISFISSIGIPSPREARNRKPRRPETSIYQDSLMDQDVAPYYVALCSFSPNLGDEIPLNRADILAVTSIYDDGWAYGTNLSTGYQGVFPLSHVQQGSGNPNKLPAVRSDRKPTGDASASCERARTLPRSSTSVSRTAMSLSIGLNAQDLALLDRRPGSFIPRSPESQSSVSLRGPGPCAKH